MMRARNVLALSGAAFLLCLGVPDSAESANNGIQALVAVAQMKAQEANQEALEGADKQRKLIKKSKDVRVRQQLSELAKLNEQHAKKYAVLATQLKDIQARLKKADCK